MEDATPRLLLVGRAGRATEIVGTALAGTGIDIVRSEPERVLAELNGVSPRGVLVVANGPEDYGIAGDIAGRAAIPILVLESPAEGMDEAPLARSAEAFARHLSPKPTEVGPFQQLRVLVVTSRWDKSEVFVRALQAAGATVATADPSGRDLANVRSIDPQVALLDVTPEGEAELLAKLRADPILRWAVHLPFEWDVLEKEDGTPRLDELSRIIEAWLEPERDLVRSVGKGPASSSLDAIGLGRALRALDDIEAPLRIHVTSMEGRAQIDLANGMVAGATFWQAVDDSPCYEGGNALAAALCLHDASLRTEACTESMPANIAASVSDALKAARLLTSSMGQDMQTDPQVTGWKRSEQSATVPSLRLMIGTLAELGIDDTVKRGVVPPNPPPPEEVPVVAPHAFVPAGALPPAHPFPPRSSEVFLAKPPPENPSPAPAPRRRSGPPFALIGMALFAMGCVVVAGFLVWRNFTSEPPRPTRVASAPVRVRPEPPPVQPVPPVVPPAVQLLDAGPAAVVPTPPPVVPSEPTPPPVVPSEPPVAPGDPLAAAIAQLHPNTSFNELRRIAPPVADLAAARERSDAILTQGESLVRARDLVHAEPKFQEAFLVCPSNPHASAALAELYLDRGRPGVALSWARNALALRRGRPEYQELVDRAEEAVARRAP